MKRKSTVAWGTNVLQLVMHSNDIKLSYRNMARGLGRTSLYTFQEIQCALPFPLLTSSWLDLLLVFSTWNKSVVLLKGHNTLTKTIITNKSSDFSHSLLSLVCDYFLTILKLGDTYIYIVTSRTTFTAPICRSRILEKPCQIFFSLGTSSVPCHHHNRR
jgi:hypothetical protein